MNSPAGSATGRRSDRFDLPRPAAPVGCNGLTEIRQRSATIKSYTKVPRNPHDSSTTPPCLLHGQAGRERDRFGTLAGRVWDNGGTVLRSEISAGPLHRWGGA